MGSSVPSFGTILWSIASYLLRVDTFVSHASTPTKLSNISPYFYLSNHRVLYNENIRMIPDRLTWKKPTELVLPPPNKRTRGRPKINRARGADEEGRSSRTKPNRCGRCKEYGHNSRTCKNEAYVRPPRRGRGNGRGVSRGVVGNAGDGVGVPGVENESSWRGRVRAGRRPRGRAGRGVGVGVPGDGVGRAANAGDGVGVPGVPGSSIGVPGSSNAYDGAGVGFFGDFSSQATGMTSAACFQPRFALGIQESTNAARRCNE